MRRPCAKLKDHTLGCDCQSCMAMVMAVLARNPDGTPFFTDSELYQLAANSGEEFDVA